MNTCVRWLLLFALFQFHSRVCWSSEVGNTTELSELNRVFLQELINDHGRNNTISTDILFSLLKSPADTPIEHHVKTGVTINTKHDTRLKNITCFSSGVPSEEVHQCLSEQCLALEDVYQLYNLHTTSQLNVSQLQEVAPVLLYVITQNCSAKRLSVDEVEHEAPPPLAVWGYGFLFVTLINLCSLVGVIVLPCMKMAAYKQILIFMVALAVGALAGSGLLFLIPEAFGLVHDGDLTYVYKASTVMGGIYLFYLTERIMRMLTAWKERRNQRKKDAVCERQPHGIMDIICSVKKSTPLNQEQIYKETASLPAGMTTCNTQTTLLDKCSDESTSSPDENPTDRDISLEDYEKNPQQLEKHKEHKATVKPLAWMIIFGDGLHNFIDGLSIGTAFTQSHLAGISVSLAVMCEELPHELGDFAILLNCGMSVKRALMFNFLSACMCYFGLIIGTILGENTTSHDWVFAIAGGMFLYISLADMMPEMNSASEAEDGHRYGTNKVFLLQNLGLIVGFGIMFLMAVFGDQISIE